MRLLEFVAHVFVGWLVVATIVAGAWSIAVTRLKARRPQRPEVVNWLPLLPPVPPPTTPPLSQTVAAADWFRDMPSDCLSDEAIRILSDDIGSHFRVIDGAA